MLRRRLWIVCAFALFIAAATAVAEAAADWRFVTRERDVLVSTRTEPGRSHPTFRGEYHIEAPVLHVLAVVLDTPAAVRWARGADRVEVLNRQTPDAQLVRMITDLPWPIRDREMVMDRTVTVLEPGKVFDVRFACATGKRPEEKGYVRVRECDSHFLVRAVDSGHTYVDYRAYLDPGGGLPSWGVRWMEKRVAVDTLSRLGRQVRKTLGQYDSEIARLSQLR
jgi:START domain